MRNDWYSAVLQKSCGYGGIGIGSGGWGMFTQHRNAQSRLSQRKEWTKWTNECFYIFMFVSRQIYLAPVIPFSLAFSV